jgi:hypothetical protein
MSQRISERHEFYLHIVDAEPGEAVEHATAGRRPADRDPRDAGATQKSRLRSDKVAYECFYE